MRILHTADWHVGRTIRGRSRADEHGEVLAEIVAVAAAEQVDLVLVAGDVFDTAAPSPEAERIVYAMLLDLVATGAEVVVVAGNHDSAPRLEAVAPLLATNRIHVGARPVPPEAGGVLELDIDSGERARIALLPFVSQRGIVRAVDLMTTDADQHAQAYAARVQTVIERLTDGFTDEAVNLVVSHLMVSGGEVGGSERTAHTIFDYCVPATVFPSTAHYVALGHLHRPQRMAAACPVWYAGSPLQLDFGEEDDDKAVLLVDATPGAPAEVRQHRLTGGRRLRTLRGTLDELAARKDEAAADHLRVIVRGQARAGLAEQVREWFPTAVDVAVEAGADRDGRAAPPRRLRRSPRALFGEYLQE
ncbi:MAG: metallophosphoesterase family protein, partial [Egibacteraceae bacterium]